MQPTLPRTPRFRSLVFHSVRRTGTPPRAATDTPAPPRAVPLQASSPRRPLPRRPRATSRRQWLVRLLPPLAAACVLAACGSVGGGSGGGVFGGSGLSGEMEALRDQMRRTFDGTPVEISTADRALKVTVPLKHSFTPKRYPVKAPLAKVLEKLAPGVVNNSKALLRVAQPTDPTANAALLRERRDSLQDMLRGLGVPAERLQVSADTSGEELTVLVVEERGG